MTKPINNMQTTAESWEISAPLNNTGSAKVVLYKDENGIYHTIRAQQIMTEILADGMTEAVVLTGEIAGTDPTADV